MLVRKLTLLLIASITTLMVCAQVPSEMEFGGMQLKLSDGVRKKLQADLDMITRSPKSFQIKVDRANLYFPIIEQIFREEEIPEDFKFLCLQESSLVPDAVSTSNAVGYWQFKKETAIEVGMRVDHKVDERMNIVSASRGAAKYLKKNNSLYFNNWVYALLSYNLGAGGAKSKIKEKYIGASKMVIDEDMHWYVIRFLAHKLAFENAVGKNLTPAMVLMLYNNCKNKSLHDVAKETETDYPNLEAYNKWVLKGDIPDDKDYYVVLPVSAQHQDKFLAKNDVVLKPAKESGDAKKEPKESTDLKVRFERIKRRRTEVELTGTGDVALLISLNRIKTIKAKEGDTPAKLAIQGGISTGDFLKYNDLKSFEQIKPGEFYYLQPKKNKAIEMYHTVQYGETLRDIAQKHGIRIEAIRTKNRLGKNENPVPGRVLWLRRKRPESTPVEIKKVQIPVPPKIEKVEPAPQEQIGKETVDFTGKDTISEVPTVPLQMEKKEEPADPAANYEYHIVKQGETLYSISRTYAISLESLKEWNHLSGNEIKLGDKLIVRKNSPAVSPVETSTVEHIVQPGETLYQISKKYGVSVENIQAWNNKQDTRISLGEKLIIKQVSNK